MKILDNFSGYAHWFLRIALGSVFLYHGLTKFPVLNEMAGAMGLPVAVVLLLAIVETGGAILVLLGGFFQDWMTRLGALLLVPPMLGAIFMVHWGRWSFTPSETHPMGGVEFQVTLLLLMLYLIVKGNNVNRPEQTPAV